VDNGANLGQHTYTAIMGYRNDTGGNVYIPVGDQNQVSLGGTGSVQSQPTWILAGTHNGVLLQPFMAWTSVTWQLGVSSAEATPSSPACTIDNSGTTPKVKDASGNPLFDLTLQPNQVPGTERYSMLSGQIVATDVFPAGSNTTVGKIDGTFAVTDDGAATYRMPLWVPAGRAGVQPSLALAYSSSGGDGIMGMGWRLDGFSVITRCPQDYARDVNRKAIQFDEDDRLCLDGQRLVLVSPPGTWNRADSEYRTEIDKYMKIVQVGEEKLDGQHYSAIGFLVYLPDGTRRSYGLPANGARDGYNGQPSAVLQTSRATETFDDGSTANPTVAYDTPARLGWALASSRDRYDNEILYSYHPIDSGENGENVIDFRPDEISYTYSSGQAANSKIKFYYDQGVARKDVRNSYVGGLPLRIGHALTGITMQGPNPTGVGLLRSYEFVYQNDQERLLLRTVAECDADHVCKPVTSFDWTPGDTTFVRKPTGLMDHTDFGRSGTDKSNAGAIAVGDFNGDGVDDIIYTKSDSTAVCDQTPCDPCDNVCNEVDCIPCEYHTCDSTRCYDNKTFYSSTYVRLANRSQAADRSSVFVRFGEGKQVANGISYAGLANGIRVVDFNLDGVSDFIQPKLSQYILMYDYPTNVGGQSMLVSPAACGREHGQVSLGAAFCPVQCNGADITCSAGSIPGNSDCDLYWCQGEPNQVPPISVTGGTIPSDKLASDGDIMPIVGDINGDGLPDIVRPFWGEASPMWSYRLNSKTGFAHDYTYLPSMNDCFPDGHCEIGYSGYTRDDLANSYAVDINGDGKQEILLWDSTFKHHGNTATRMRALMGLDSGNVPTALLASGKKAGSLRYQFADVNGDGLQDAVEIPIDGGSSIRVWINNGRDFLSPITVSLNGSDTMGQSLNHDNSNGKPRDPGLRIIDFNGDGRADLIQLGNSCMDVTDPSKQRGAVTVQIANASGTPFAPGITLAVSGGGTIPLGDQSYDWDSPGSGCGGGYGTSQILDVNGDGLADIVQVENGQIVLYIRQGKQPGLLNTITDGLGNKTLIDYLPITDPGVHTPVECSYPQYCNIRGKWLVSSHTLANDSLTPLTYSHTYTGARTDVTGVGWLGMDSHTVEDISSSATTTRHATVTTTYDHTSMLDGTNIYASREQPKSRSESYPMDVGDLLDFGKVSAHQCHFVAAAGPRAVLSSCEDDYNESEVYGSPGCTPSPGVPCRGVVSTLIKRKTSTTYNSDYGYVVMRSTDIGTSADTSTHEFEGWVGQAWYDNDANNWISGLTKYEQTYHVVPGSSVTRRTYYSRNTTTGAIMGQTIEPDARQGTGDPNYYAGLYRETDYERNGVGQITKTTDFVLDDQGNPSQTRVATTSYDPVSGVYPTVVTNALGQSTLSMMHPGLGVLLETVDATGLRTTRQYDKFGRLRGESLPDGTTSSLSYSMRIASGVLPYVPFKVTSYVQGKYQEDLYNGQGLKIGVVSQKYLANDYYTREAYWYDSHGRISQRAKPSLSNVGTGPTIVVMSYSYDSMGRVVHEIGPLSETHYAYAYGATTRTRLRTPSSGEGSTDEVDETWTDRAGRVSSRVEKVGALQTSPDHPGGNTHDVTTQYAYGPFNLLTDVWVTSGDQTQTAHTHAGYDIRGRRTSLSDPDTGAWQDSYDGYGQLVERKHLGSANDGSPHLKYSYDLLGRQFTETT
jgi:YD repeat-containing protein